VAGGTASLKLPWATTDGISFANAFFVAVSCSTVTGLSTVAIPETFTHFGELLMMVLMQLGGLGIMTLTTAKMATPGYSSQMPARAVEETA
jgi:trk system potassium uptake protein